jgi:hypothetical protein
MYGWSEKLKGFHLTSVKEDPLINAMRKLSGRRRFRMGIESARSIILSELFFR